MSSIFTHLLIEARKKDRKEAPRGINVKRNSLNKNGLLISGGAFVGNSTFSGCPNIFTTSIQVTLNFQGGFRVDY
jgi:hypothetical protein